jgi:multidrug resistance efflux pump
MDPTPDGASVMRKVVILAIVAAGGVIGWLYWHQHRRTPLVVSGFIEADQIRVGSRVGGRVAEVLINEGDSVRAAQPLVRIDPFDLKETLADAQAQLAAYEAEHQRLKTGFRPEEIEQARAKRDRAAAVLAKLVAGPRPAEISIAREKANAAKANLDLAESENARIMKLNQQAQAAQMEVDRAIQSLKAGRAAFEGAKLELALMEEGTRKEDIAEARAVLADAESGLALVQRGYRSEDIAKAEAQVLAARARVAAIKIRMQELTVAAPCDCVVESIDLRPGDLVSQGSPSVSLLDLSRMWVRAYVPESNLGQIRLGQHVPVRVDSFPGRQFKAHITFIAQQGEFTPRNIQTPEERSKQVFRIKMTLDEGKDRLRVGMAADVLLDEAGGP